MHIFRNVTIVWEESADDVDGYEVCISYKGDPYVTHRKITAVPNLTVPLRINAEITITVRAFVVYGDKGFTYSEPRSVNSRLLSIYAPKPVGQIAVAY